jgi:hypothetical protein
MRFSGTREFRLPAWAPIASIALALAFAWINFLTTSRWAAEAGALHGWRKPWYVGALVAATLLVIVARREIGGPTRLGRPSIAALLASGAAVLLAALFHRLPLSVWTDIPFKDDWTELFQMTVNGVTLLRHGALVGWNWWFLGGYPTSTDIAQNFSLLAFVPMTVFGDTLGYHVLHAVLFLAVPCFVWWDLGTEDQETRVLATAFACFFGAGYLYTLTSSGDTNSMVGVFCVGLALVSSHAARRSRRWGGPVMLLALTLALSSHAAFAIYAGAYLLVESIYFRDRAAFLRLATASTFAAVAALPVHWESLRYPQFVSFNNTVYQHGEPTQWGPFARNVFYNVEILLLPHRWFNDYRSLANIWLLPLVLVALTARGTRTGFYAACAVLTQALLRLNTPVAGAMFDRIQHLLPLLTAPALAGLILQRGGRRSVAVAMALVLTLYVATSWEPVRHVPDLRAFDPPLIDRIAASDGSLVLVEVSPHRDMDSNPARRTPPTPFDVHFEGLLPAVAGQRFYSQMIDGWVWNIFRGQVVGAGTFAGQLIDLTPPDQFAAEMRRWGIRHLFVWTDTSRNYLGRSGHFVERWRAGLWSDFEMTDADVRSVVTVSGSGELRALDFLGGDVALTGVKSGEPVVVRANYYPAWRAVVDGQEVPLRSSNGQLAFSAPRDGSYVVRLEYPRYRVLSGLALLSVFAGIACLGRWPGLSSRASTGSP